MEGREGGWMLGWVAMEWQSRRVLRRSALSLSLSLSSTSSIHRPLRPFWGPLGGGGGGGIGGRFVSLKVH